MGSGNTSHDDGVGAGRTDHITSHLNLMARGIKLDVDRLPRSEYLG